MEIRKLVERDYPDISLIYKQGIDTQIATFQNEIPTWEHWDNAHHQFCRLGLCLNAELLAWAALSPTSKREVYAGVAEVSIYIKSTERNKGLGQMLLQALIAESEQKGIWTLYSSIFAENKSSIVLHEKCGFRKVGFREKIAHRNGIWHDNIIFERRSKIVGI